MWLQRGGAHNKRLVQLHTQHRRHTRKNFDFSMVLRMSDKRLQNLRRKVWFSHCSSEALVRKDMTTAETSSIVLARLKLVMVS